MELNSKLLGISCVILAHVFFTTQDMTIKFINGDYALYQVMLIRSIVAMLFTLLIFVPIDGGYKHLLTQRQGLHFLRGFGIVITNFCFFSALITMPLAEVVAIFFIAPLLITKL